ncbi:unnamed protein product [Mytilus coruscus]|uniref:Uncharacterized protein n=1 Tax=Mytilus coruscus TaxID=42192 RepID=A0A6J8EDV3_MYTCO|nr:unnamed protein product [Mytilus coruscus]
MSLNKIDPRKDFEPYLELFSSSSSSSNNDDVCDHNFVRVDDRVKECLICGVEHICNRFSHGDDFECLNLGKTFHKSKHPPQQPQCSSMTNRGHQCTHPCQPNQDLCLRHMKLKAVSTKPQQPKCSVKQCVNECHPNQDVCFDHTDPKPRN